MLCILILFIVSYSLRFLYLILGDKGLYERINEDLEYDYQFFEGIIINRNLLNKKVIDKLHPNYQLNQQPHIL